MPIVLAVPVVDVVVALAILLLVWASSVLLVKPLVWVLSMIPVIGGNIGAAVQGAVNGVVSWAASWAKSALAPIIQIVSVPIGAVARFAGELVQTAETIGARIVDLFAGLTSLAGQVVTNAVSTGVAIAGLVGRVAAVAATIPGIAAEVARSLIASAMAAVNQAIAALRAGLAAAVAAEQALVAAARGDLVRIIAGQAAVAAAALAATAGTLRQEWTRDLGGVRAEVDQLGQLVRPIAAAGLLTLVPAIVSEIEQLRRVCIDPMCRVTSPQIPTLTALGDIATMLVVGGLVGEAVANPEGTAKATAAVIDEVHGAAAGLVGAFAGIHI